MENTAVPNIRIGNMTGLTNVQLGESNAIWLWFGQKETNWAPKCNLNFQ